tara:strand:- start:146 stop:661 length:516 start_codon:yes stop_codon:yes gene_type:complete
VSKIKYIKGFTLIELLVVVAIIGILAAVGVVAYNGYTASAKKATIKTNYKNIVKKFINENGKCMTDDSLTAYDGLWNCSQNNPSYIVAHVAQYYNHAGKYNPISNPYNVDGRKNVDFVKIRNCSDITQDKEYGYMFINFENTGTGIKWNFCTCIAQPCSNSKNRLQNEFIK